MNRDFCQRNFFPNSRRDCLETKVMLETTIQVLKAGLQSDSTISPADRMRILAAIRKAANDSKSDAAPASAPRLIRRAEVARRIGCSLRLVDRLAADGILLKRRLPNRQRAAGFLEQDVTNLIAAKQ